MKKIIFTIAFLLGSTSIFASNMEVYSQVSGKIIYIKEVGSQVKKGDVLVRIDTKQIDAKIKSEDSKAKYKKVTFDDATQNLADYTELYESTVAPKRELDLAVIKEQKAKYDYEEQKAMLRFYQLEKAKYIIKASSAGTISKHVSPRNATNVNNAKALMEISTK